MRLLFIMFKIELILSIRRFDSILFGVLFPAGVAFLMGSIYSSNSSMIQSSFAAISVIGICATGLMGLPLTLADYRHKKVLKRFKVTPVSPLQLLVVQVFVHFLISFVSTTLVFIIMSYLFGYNMTGSFLIFILSYMLVLISIFSLGLLIASIASNIRTANLVCTIVYFPMLFLSGATIPYEVMPKPLQLFSNFLPLTIGIKLLKKVSTDIYNNITYDIITLSCLTIIAIIVSLRFFKWE